MSYYGALAEVATPGGATQTLLRNGIASANLMEAYDYFKLSWMVRLDPFTDNVGQRRYGNSPRSAWRHIPIEQGGEESKLAFSDFSRACDRYTSQCPHMSVSVK